MKTLNTQIEQWNHSAQKKIDNDSICQADLDYLSSILLSQHIRQRILYIHAVTPSIRSQLIAMSLHEPIKDQIAEIDPDYGEWVASLENPSKLMVGFHEYVKRRQRTRPRDTGDDTCSICLDRTIDSAFIPCGHQAACVECARRLEGPCPICREPIADLLQTFLAGAAHSSASA